MSKAVRQQYAREYQTYRDMKHRCTNPKANHWHRYGGRGITVCAQWLESFENFMDDMGPRPEGLTLDRVDNDKGYSPDNCEWRTRKEQQNNRRPQPMRPISTEDGVGVYQRASGLWATQLTCVVNGKEVNHYLGTFDTKHQASEVRKSWANLYNYIRGHDPRQYPHHNTTPTTGDIS